MSTTATLALLSAAHFACHYFLLIFPTAVLAIERDWSMSYGQALALGTPMYVAFAIATPVAGWLGDRFRGERLIALQLIGLGAASAAAASAQDPITLQAALAAVGVFAALYHPVGLAMVTRLAQRHGRALAVNGVFGNLGLAAAMLATAALSDHLGWRSAFLAPAPFALLLGLWAWLAARRRRPGEMAPRQGVQHDRRQRPPSLTDQRRVVIVVLAAALLSGLAFNGVTASFPKLLEERLGAFAPELSDVGLYAALVFAAAAFAQLPVGALLDRFGGRAVLLLVFAAQAAALAALAGSSGALAFPTALMAVTLMFAGIPVSGWLLGRYVAGAWRSRAFAAEYLLSLGVGAAVVPTMAALHDAGYGLDRQYALFALGVAFVAAFALVLPGRAARSRSVA